MDAVEVKVDELLSACLALGIMVSFDEHISEADAATLLGKSRFTLRNRRLTDQPLQFRKLGRTPEYALIELARFIVTGANLE
jgi:hypothetical protein